jgi:predicted alpha-1,6-mannanase (GH76 family)
LLSPNLGPNNNQIAAIQNKHTTGSANSFGVYTAFWKSALVGCVETASRRGTSSAAVSHRNSSYWSNKRRRTMSKLVADQFAETLAAAGVAKGFTLYMLKAVLDGRAEDLVDLARTNLWA